MTYDECVRVIEKAEKDGATELDLSDQGLEKLPPEIGRLTQLTSLNLDNNQLRELPESLTRLTQLTSLDLGENQLSELPESLTRLTQLTSLNLDNNQLRELPESLTRLTQLTSLHLSGNQLSELPESLIRLTQLTSLNLYNNHLTELPESITRLTQLTSLDLGGNQLSELPESLSRLTQLTSLYLYDNQLTELPESITRLTQLTSLNLGRNRFSKLPESITRLTQLASLIVWENRLTEVPHFLTGLKNLQLLDLRGNEGLPLSPEILANRNDAPAILKHIEEIADLKLELEDTMSSLADVDVDVKEKKAAKTEPGTTGLRPEAKAGEKKEPPKSPGVTEKGREPATTPSAEPGRVLAGFQSDSIGMDDKDKLDIEGVVEAFCSVMLSQKVHPPLSIGLFGDWGSGKSFFMEEMWRQVKALTKEAREKDSSDWHGHVAQIRFNAWHYSDANLWASFVTHIFDELAKFINPGDTLQETRTRLLHDLETSKALREEARYELDDAQNALEQRKGDLRKARDNLQAKRWYDRALELSDQLGIAGGWETPGQLNEAVEQAKTTGGRLQNLWSDFRHSRLTMIVVFLPLLLVGVDFVLQRMYPEGFGGLVDLIAAVWAEFIVISGSVGTLLHSAGKKLKELDQVRGRLIGLAQEREAESLRPAQDDIADLQTRITQAEAAAVRADQRVSEAERAVRDASAGRRFYRFIEERAASHDYRKHLGLISMVHRDFEQLGELLMDCEPYVAEKPEGNQEADSVNGGGEVRAVEEKEKVAKIERIILYIDDLDRCRPEVVVETLQAVHLLLALPLFVVVVGVDSRWLLRALEAHYPEFLSVGSRRRSGTRQPTKDGKPDKAKEEDENNATTPQNYLEKIFQIPFCLPEMEEHGFGRLIEALANPKEEATRTKDSKAPGARAWNRKVPVRRRGRARQGPLKRRG